MMLFWFVVAALTVLALAFLIPPLLRKDEEQPDRNAYDISVYKDQLSEVDRDLERGLINADEADAARVEVQRRILALDKDTAEHPEAPKRTKPALVLAIVIGLLLPVGAVVFYLASGGQPGLPDAPADGRTPGMEGMTQDQAQQVEKMVQGLADKMKDNPQDVEGWIKLGRSYDRLGRYKDAAEAYRRALDVEIPTAQLLIEFALVQTRANDDNIDDEAQAAFLRAFKGMPDSADALYYLGVAAVQRDKPEDGIAYLKHLVTLSPADAPWLEQVQSVIDGVAADFGLNAQTIVARAPDTSNVEAPADHSVQQASKVNEMVARLEGKLKDNPEDFDGWMRLAKSYAVLGRDKDALEAYDKADALNPQATEPKVGKVSVLLKMSESSGPTDVPVEVAKIMTRVLELDPKNPDALYLLGFIAERMGDQAQAKRLWTTLRDQYEPESTDYLDIQSLIDGLNGAQPLPVQ
ncbi:MAG: c-type cytochrome biogenesis protein CcmI [Alphaproteobacteria bacterium RIFOXYD12_FULL_60_8]|nr:MAG: c-type cytochrome biogenesis protein CcmI [Alphaproteobacteria bacterium RIFOXYD12_FULL_60_8]